MLWVCCDLLPWCNMVWAMVDSSTIWQMLYLVLASSIPLSCLSMPIFPTMKRCNVSIRSFDHHKDAVYWPILVLIDNHIMMCRRKAKNHSCWCTRQYVRRRWISRAAWTIGLSVKKSILWIHCRCGCWLCRNRALNRRHGSFLWVGGKKWNLIDQEGLSLFSTRVT